MNTTDIVTQLKPVFEKVAEKIGAGAEFGWTVVMRQQYVVATQSLVGAIIAAIVAYKLFPLIKKSFEEDWGDGFVCFLVSVSFITTLAFSVAFTMEAVSHFINPQYYALQFFIGMVK